MEFLLRLDQACVGQGSRGLTILDGLRFKMSKVDRGRRKPETCPNRKGRGRPTVRTENNRLAILNLVSQAKSLREIARLEGMPSRDTIALWLAEDPEFSDQYRRAWEASADIDFEEMYEIVDDGSNDWMERHDRHGNFVGWRLNGESVARSALRLKQRQWAAARKAPKKYGQAVDLTIGGSGNPIQTITCEMTEAEAAAAYAMLIRGG